MASKRRALYAQAVAQTSPPPLRPRVKPRDVTVEHYSPTHSVYSPARRFYDVTSSGDPLYQFTKPNKSAGAASLALGMPNVLLRKPGLVKARPRKRY